MLEPFESNLCGMLWFGLVPEFEFIKLTSNQAQFQPSLLSQDDLNRFADIKNILSYNGKRMSWQKKAAGSIADHVSIGPLDVAHHIRYVKL